MLAPASPAASQASVGATLLQVPPPRVTNQVEAAVTDTGNTMLSGVNGVLTTLELVPPPPPPARHLLQEAPPHRPQATLSWWTRWVPVCSASLASAHILVACQTVVPVACLLLSHLRHSHCVCHQRPHPAQLQQLPLQKSVQGDVGELLSAATGITGGVTGISGRRLLQGPPPPVSAQLVGALTDAGNIVLDGADAALTTLQLVPPPPAS